MFRRAHLVLLHMFRRLPRPARRFAVRRLYPSFTVGAMCVIERPDGALLFVRHSYRRQWGVPGGLLSRGEEPAVGARREAKEEVALDIETVGEPAISTASPDDVRASSPEIVEAKWFPRDELPALQHETAGALASLARATSERG
jgi:8-oxo-dGTP diphosphatase